MTFDGHPNLRSFVDAGMARARRRLACALRRVDKARALQKGNDCWTAAKVLAEAEEPASEAAKTIERVVAELPWARRPPAPRRSGDA